MKNRISKKAIVGKNVQFGNTIEIGPNVIIEDDVYIGNNTTVDNVIIKEGTVIEANCIIGYSNATGWVSRETDPKDLLFDNLKIGKGVLIREGSTLYKGSDIGDYVKIHHKVLIREQSLIGEHSSIGSMSDLEGHLIIGKNCSIHSNNHLCYDTRIGDYVFIAPFCVTTNGNPMRYKRPLLYEKFGTEKGPTIESGCQLAVNVVILPAVTIGHECIIGASAVVIKSFEPLSGIMGVPARKVGEVEESHRLPITIRKELSLDD
jgi:acetyltransferase-like isoleucine patch superfamily enzyme